MQLIHLLLFTEATWRDDACCRDEVVWLLFVESWRRNGGWCCLQEEEKTITDVVGGEKGGGRDNFHL